MVNQVKRYHDLSMQVSTGKFDWNAYESKAVMRGKLMLCISPDIVKSWYVDNTEPRKPGGQSLYTDKCVEDLMGLKYLLGLNYRALEGFAKALLTMGGLNSSSCARSHHYQCTRK